MTRRSRYSRELRERAVRLVLDQQGEYDSEWETLRNWVRRVEVDTGRRDGVTSDERARIKDLEREVGELRRTNEILRKASAYFAQAELDRRPR